MTKTQSHGCKNKQTTLEMRTSIYRYLKILLGHITHQYQYHTRLQRQRPVEVPDLKIDLCVLLQYMLYPYLKTLLIARITNFQRFCLNVLSWDCRTKRMRSHPLSFHSHPQPHHIYHLLSPIIEISYALSRIN